MKETDDLQLQQYQRLYWEEDTPLHDVRKSTLRKFVYIASMLCLLFLMIAFFVRFPDQVALRFVIKSDGSEEVYRFSNPIYVIEKYVKPQDQVEIGQPLIRITSDEIVNLVHDYREAEQNIVNFSKQKLLSVEKEKEIISNKIDQNNENSQKAANELKILESTWKSNLSKLEYENADAIAKYETNKKLFEEKVISKLDLTTFEASKIRAADALASARQNYIKTKASLTSQLNQHMLENAAAGKEFAKVEVDKNYDSISISNQLQLVKNKIRNTYGDFDLIGDDVVLKANAAGLVSYIFDGEKEVVSGAILLKVLKKKTALYAAAKSPPALIGRITKDKKAVLKVASFPFYEWGTVKGHIENVSLTPNESGSFSVKIALDDIGNLGQLLQIGMDGEATIIVEEKTFYQYFFRRVKKSYFKMSGQL